MQIGKGPASVREFGAVALAMAVLAGCSGPKGLLDQQSGLVTGSPSVLPVIELPAADPEPTGSPTEIYTRIARGATNCWFGSHGPLKATHIFHADAESPTRGGRSEIVIHERDPAQPNPRGNKAFRVTITPSADTATVEIVNARFPAEIGQKMTSDVRRWGRGDLRCSDAAPVSGWEASQRPPELEQAKPAGAKRREHKI